MCHIASILLFRIVMVDSGGLIFNGRLQELGREREQGGFNIDTRTPVWAPLGRRVN